MEGEWGTRNAERGTEKQAHAKNAKGRNCIGKNENWQFLAPLAWSSAHGCGKSLSCVERTKKSTDHT